MRNNPNPQEFSMRDVAELMQTQAGQQLLAYLQSIEGNRLQDAAAKAASGDYQRAREIITSLLSSPDAQKLLEQLGRK